MAVGCLTTLGAVTDWIEVTLCEGAGVSKIAG